MSSPSRAQVPVVPSAWKADRYPAQRTTSPGPLRCPPSMLTFVFLLSICLLRIARGPAQMTPRFSRALAHRTWHAKVPKVAGMRRPPTPLRECVAPAGPCVRRPVVWLPRGCPLREGRGCFVHFYPWHRGPCLTSQSLLNNGMNEARMRYDSKALSTGGPQRGAGECYMLLGLFCSVFLVICRVLHTPCLSCWPFTTPPTPPGSPGQKRKDVEIAEAGRNVSDPPSRVSQGLAVSHAHRRRSAGLNRLPGQTANALDVCTTSPCARGSWVSSWTRQNFNIPVPKSQLSD